MSTSFETTVSRVLQHAQKTVEPTDPTSVLEAGETRKEHGTFDGHLLVPPSNVTIRTLFSHPASHPIVLDMAVIAKYGTDWLEWEPETIQFSIQRDFGNLSDLNMSKLMAMKTLHVVDSFWKSWEIFNICTMSLNGIFPDFEVMQVPNVAQCMVSVEIADKVRLDVTWSEEIKVYLSKVHEYDGIYVTQSPLETMMSETELEKPEFSTIDVRKEWPTVRRTRKAPTGSSPVEEQLRRMLTVYEYLEESRTRLRSQLPLVNDVS